VRGGRERTNLPPIEADDTKRYAHELARRDIAVCNCPARWRHDFDANGALCVGMQHPKVGPAHGDIRVWRHSRSHSSHGDANDTRHMTDAVDEQSKVAIAGHVSCDISPCLVRSRDTTCALA